MHIDDAEYEALRRDAARYRWLRDRQNQYSGKIDLRAEDFNEDGPTDVYYSLWGDELDAHIDAAMAGEE